MKKSRCIAGALAIAFGLAAASQAWAQPRPRQPKKPTPPPRSAVPKDRVIHQDGEAEGSITGESWKEITITTAKGAERIPSELVQFVIYKDAPPAWEGVIDRVMNSDYRGGTNNLNNVEQYFKEEAGKPDGKKPPPWMDAYVVYFRGICQAGDGNHKAAANYLMDFLSRHGTKYHVTRKALMVCFDALKAVKDVEKAKQLRNLALPAEIKPFMDLKMAEFLRAAGEPREAQKICEELRLSHVAEIKNAATRLMFECLKDLGAEADLRKAAQDILQTSQDRAARFIAEASLGEMSFKGGDLNGAVRHLTRAIVLDYAQGVEKQHEQALWVLAQAYEKMAEGAKDPKVKQRFLGMASGTYMELAMNHRDGEKRGPAEAKAEELEKKSAELAKQTGGDGKESKD